MKQNPVIVWFRRDLRLQDNLAIEHALSTGQPIIPLFIFDPAILTSTRLSVVRLKFMLKALKSLNIDLQKHHGELLIRQGSPLSVIKELINETNADALFYNLDYTPYARKRDNQIERSLDINVYRFHDRLLVRPDDIHKNDGDPYKVYTPFKNKWRKLIKSEQAEIYHLKADNLYCLGELQNGKIPSLEELGFDVRYSNTYAQRTRGRKTSTHVYVKRHPLIFR